MMKRCYACIYEEGHSGQCKRPKPMIDTAKLRGEKDYPGQGDPWADFLHYRVIAIKHFLSQGKTPAEVAVMLSMDGPMQVILIDAANK